ncbi:MAG: sulfotransferase [Solirubrobacterales bacterium]
MEAIDSPLVIGGTGGSGTRVVTQIVFRAGRYMGARVNNSLDARPFARFDWRWGLRYLQRRFGEWTPEFEAELVRAHDEAVQRHLAAAGGDPVAWGWKHPHSYLMLPFLHQRHPGLRFLHMVRDGRDMAFSENQYQAERYGPTALGARWAGPEPVRSAAYWAWGNTLAADDGQELGEKYLCVRFEDLCADPVPTVRRLLGFAVPDADVDRFMEGSLRDISPPASLGRWRDAPPEEVAAITEAAGPALARFGYV